MNKVKAIIKIKKMMYCIYIDNKIISSFNNFQDAEQYIKDNLKINFTFKHIGGKTSKHIEYI